MLAAAATLLLAAPPDAEARKRAPKLSWVKCYRLCKDKRTVRRGGTIKVAGHRFRRHMRVIFRARNRNRKRTVKTQLLGRRRLLARVPGDARSGRVYVRARGGIRTNKVGPLRVRKRKRRRAAEQPAPPETTPTGTAFDGDAMWIWNVPRSEGGDPNAIVARARAHGVETVFVKSGDGARYWSQFSPGLVAALKAGGLRVCGWQYVYGGDPSGEAAVAAAAVETGADCFIIDAEREYEGRYAQAQTYVRALRTAAGPDYPIGMSSFPYVDYHPSFPYSEFFAPGGAQFNVPQVYWKTIGDSVDESLEHTYRFNRPYGRPVVPAGQAYDATTQDDILRFRDVAAAQGSAGVNWWVWEHATQSMWDAIGRPLGPFPGPPPAGDYAPIARGAEGDLVAWAQEHLQSAGHAIDVDGDFGPATEQAVTSFQASAGLPATGTIDTATWRALVDGHDPAPQSWKRGGRGAKAGADAPTGPAKSRSLPAKRYEIGR
jgi:Putative peptidoglycan binding domain